MARIQEVMVIETLTVLWDLGNRKDYSFRRKREEGRTFVRSNLSKAVMWQ